VWNWRGNCQSSGGRRGPVRVRTDGWSIIIFMRSYHLFFVLFFSTHLSILANPVEIRGRVQSPSGNGVPFVWVTLTTRSLHRAPFELVCDTRVGSLRTDDKGYFTFIIPSKIKLFKPYIIAARVKFTSGFLENASTEGLNRIVVDDMFVPSPNLQTKFPGV
jgi:hypothetical protein